MIFRHEAVARLYSNLVTTVGDKSYDSSGNLIVVDEAKVAEENAKLQADYDAKKYQRDRLAEYPSVQELVVALYDADDKAEIDKKRTEIKKKYPKPE